LIAINKAPIKFVQEIFLLKDTLIYSLNDKLLSVVRIIFHPLNLTPS